jgi:hypothetical protein
MHKIYVYPYWVRFLLKFFTVFMLKCRTTPDPHQAVTQLKLSNARRF